MVYRIAGGIGLMLLGFSMIGITSIPPVITGVALLVGGIALLAGI